MVSADQPDARLAGELRREEKHPEVLWEALRQRDRGHTHRGRGFLRDPPDHARANLRSYRIDPILCRRRTGRTGLRSPMDPLLGLFLTEFPDSFNFQETGSSCYYPFNQASLEKITKISLIVGN